MRHASALRALLLVSAALIPAAPSGAAPIGKVTAANEAMLGTPPAAPRRSLALGLEVVSDERIETTPLGAGQLVFLDRTALTVWPNSDIVLDRYIYDPARGSGEMAIGLSRGLLRFVGGAVSKENDVTITTPHAVVAVRGGIALVEVTATATRAVHVAGRYTEINGLRLSRTSAAGEAMAQGSAQYLGVLDPGAIADVFGRPPGQGTGGLPVRPDPGAIEARAQASGLTASGSGAPGAPMAPRLSTRGETEQAALSPAETADVAGITVVRQAAAARAQDGAASDPRPPEPPGPPPAPPPGPPPGSGQPTPLPGFVGGNYLMRDGRETHPDTSTPAADNLTVGPIAPIVFGRFFRTDDNGTVRIRAEQVLAGGGTGSFFNTLERDGFGVDLPATYDGQPALLNSFDDPGVFYLAAFRSGPPSASFDGRSLNFFGEPTPPNLWQAVSAGDVPVWGFELTDELFLRLSAPFSATVGDRFGAGGLSGLQIIGQPVGPVLGSDAATSSARVLAPLLQVEGTGPGQSSAFGVYTGTAFTTTAGAPMAEGTFVGTARADAFDTGLRTVLPYGFLDDGAGRTAFGPDGDYLVLGQGGRRDPAGPQNTLAGSMTGVLDGTPVGAVYGDTRLALRDSRFTVAAAQRETLGTDGAGAGRPGVPGSFLTGGFAATHAASTLNPTYLLATTAAPDVRLRFEGPTNAASAEFENLSPAGPAPGTAITGLDLAFGGPGGRSAMRDGLVFGLRDDLNGVGEVTGMVNGASGILLALPSGGVQRAFTGALASAGLTGDAGLAGFFSNPEYLRWGWWGGEVTYFQGARPPERLHLGTWVAGVTARDADLADAFAANRSATYVGFGIAHVVETLAQGRAAYVEPAIFGLTYDFGQRAGTAAIVGVMGQSFGGSVTAAAAQPGNHYGGTLTGTRDGGGTIDGAFFRGGSDPVAATAGRFAVSGTTAAGNPALAVGIVAGRQ